MVARGNCCRDTREAEVYKLKNNARLLFISLLNLCCPKMRFSMSLGPIRNVSKMGYMRSFLSSLLNFIYICDLVYKKGAKIYIMSVNNNKLKKNVQYLQMIFNSVHAVKITFHCPLLIVSIPHLYWIWYM